MTFERDDTLSDSFNLIIVRNIKTKEFPEELTVEEICGKQTKHQELEFFMVHHELQNTVWRENILQEGIL